MKSWGCSQLNPSAAVLLLLLRNSSKPGTKGVVKYESIINWLINKEAFVEDLFYLPLRTVHSEEQNNMSRSSYPHPAPALEEKRLGFRKEQDHNPGGWIDRSRSYQFWLSIRILRELLKNTDATRMFHRSTTYRNSTLEITQMHISSNVGKYLWMTHNGVAAFSNEHERSTATCNNFDKSL